MEKVHILWLFEIHKKIEQRHEDYGRTCPNCDYFLDKDNFEFSKMRNFFWGLCPEHLEIIRGLLDESENIHFQIERDMGIFREGYFRELPDGRHCSMRSKVWRDHLLSLCHRPPT